MIILKVDRVPANGGMSGVVVVEGYNLYIPLFLAQNSKN